MAILYALKVKGKFQFPVKVKELSQLDTEINKAFWCAYGISSKGSNYSMDDYMKDKIKVKIEIMEIKELQTQEGRG